MESGALATDLALVASVCVQDLFKVFVRVVIDSIFQCNQLTQDKRRELESPENTFQLSALNSPSQSQSKAVGTRSDPGKSSLKWILITQP